MVRRKSSAQPWRGDKETNCRCRQAMETRAVAEGETLARPDGKDLPIEDNLNSGIEVQHDAMAQVANTVAQISSASGQVAL